MSSQELARLEFALVGGPDRAAFDALSLDWGALSATLAQPRFAKTRLVVHVPPQMPVPTGLQEGEGMEADDPMGGMLPLPLPLGMGREDDGEGSGRGDDLDYVRQRLMEVLHDTAARNMLQID